MTWRKPSAWIGEAAIVLLLALAGWGYLAWAQRSAQQNVARLLAERQETSVKEFEAWMDARIRQTQYWAQRPDVRQLTRDLLKVQDASPQTFATLPSQKAFRADFAISQGRQGLQGYFIVSPDGRNLGSLGDDNLGATNLVWQEPEFQKQMRLQGSALSPFMTSDVPLENVGAVLDGKPMTLFVGVPIYLDEAEPAAFFMLRLPTVGLLAEQGRARLGQGGVSFLVDQFGRLHADRAWINIDLAQSGLYSEQFRGRRYLFVRDPGHNVLSQPTKNLAADRSSLPLTYAVRHLQQGDGSTLVPYRDHRGIPVVGSWTWSQKLGLGVVTEMPAAEAFARVDTARQHVLIAAIVATLLLVVMLIFRLRRSTAQLRQALVAAESASRAKGIFLANMSHEIRTPLNAVLGIAHLLSTTPLVPTQREYLNIISSSGQTLLGILNDILDYSKVEAGKLELLQAQFSLHDMIDTLASIMSINAAPKDLELVIGIDPDVPTQLIGDSHRLLQVLINLTGNAIKFTQQGDVVLHVSIDHTEGEQLHVRFEVIDTGVGISLEKQAHLFSPFMQADARVARNFGGTGLGLAICKRLVELMHGEIGVRSAEGEGSQFWFVVPLGVAVQIETQRKLTGDIRTALVIDDNPMAREFVAKSLDRLGWNAREVDCGAAAVDELTHRHREKAEGFDVLLIDWKMPGMDGLQTSKAVRAIDGLQQPPIVIMVTAFGREQVLKSPDAEMVDAVISKPATPSKILDAVMEAQAKRQQGVQVPRAAYAPARVVNRLKGLRILLVEDNYINQQVARGVLSAEGALISAVDHGQAALNALSRNASAFDLVLMDVQMPVMDGIEATRRLRREMGIKLPIVAMSAGVTREERDLCVDAGMDGFISKPLEPQVVVQTIRALNLRPPQEPETRAAVDATGTEGQLPAQIDGIDVSELVTAMNGNDAAVARLLERLEFECGKAVTDLERSLLVGDYVEFAAVTHGFKGVAANMRASAVAQQAEGLETALRENDIDALNAQFPLFRDSVLALQERLSQARNLG
jgi:signal transduction histidine kinase/DNA-binding response OmpR family regulator